MEGVTEEQITRQSPEAQAIIRLLLAQIASMQLELRQLKAKVAQLEAENKSLRRQLGKPEPSNDAPTGQSLPPKRPSSKRRRGGQPKHKKYERVLVPTAQCNEVIPLRPDACRRCGKPLDGDDPNPHRHQVYELPEIKLHITEYQQHRLHCPCCGITTCAKLPEGVATGQSGPRLVMFVALMMAMFRQSKRRVSLFCETLFGHSLSPGLVVKLQEQATASLQPCYDELTAALPEQPIIYADETGTRQGNKNAWIWTTVAATFTVFTIRLTKAASVIKELLGECFRGIVVSDRAKTYHWLDRHQWCWAHLKRDFEKIALREGTAGDVGKRLLEATHRLFHLLHRIRDGDITEPGFCRQIGILRGDVMAALESGCACADRATAATCRELSNNFANLWVFQYNRKVAATNNGAERSLRHAVIWRRLSFGTQSESGSRFVATMLTIIETCRQQRRNVFEFLCTAHRAALTSKPHPSLRTGV